MNRARSFYSSKKKRFSIIRFLNFLSHFSMLVRVIVILCADDFFPFIFLLTLSFCTINRKEKEKAKATKKKQISLLTF